MAHSLDLSRNALISLQSAECRLTVDKLTCKRILVGPVGGSRAMHLVIAPFAIVVAGIWEADLPLARLLVLDEIAIILAIVAVDHFSIASAHSL